MTNVTLELEKRVNQLKEHGVGEKGRVVSLQKSKVLDKESIENTKDKLPSSDETILIV